MSDSHQEHSSLAIRLDSEEDHNQPLRPTATTDSSASHQHCKSQSCKRPHGPNPFAYVTTLRTKLFVYGVTFSVWYITYFHLCEPLEKPFNKNGSQLLITFFVFMASISYYKCSNANTHNPTDVIPAHASPENSATCKTCQYWKPERTHHCSRCGQCVLRMDHHCPWVANCVGYRNHKSFFLFCLYLGTGGLFYFYRTIYFLSSILSADKFKFMGFWFLAFWAIVSMIAVPFGCAVTGLAAFHFNLALNNMTTIESMGGMNMRKVCDSEETIEKRLVNKYHRGFLANLSEFFGDNYWLWWWPTVKSFHTGQDLEYIPPPKNIEITDYRLGKNNTETKEERIMKPRGMDEIDLQEVFKLGENFAQGKVFHFFEKVLNNSTNENIVFGENQSNVAAEQNNEAATTANE